MAAGSSNENVTPTAELAATLDRIRNVVTPMTTILQQFESSLKSAVGAATTLAQGLYTLGERSTGALRSLWTNTRELLGELEFRPETNFEEFNQLANQILPLLNELTLLGFTQDESRTMLSKFFLGFNLSMAAPEKRKNVITFLYTYVLREKGRRPALTLAEWKKGFIVEIKKAIRDTLATERLYKLITGKAVVTDGNEQGRCRRYIADGARVDFRDNSAHQFPLLHLCILHDASHYLTILINAYANAAITDAHGRTPLHYALWYGLREGKMLRNVLRDVVGTLTAERDVGDMRGDGEKFYTGYQKWLAVIFTLGISHLYDPMVGDHRDYTNLHLLARYGKDADVDLVAPVFNPNDAKKKIAGTFFNYTAAELASSTVISRRITQLTDEAEAAAAMPAP